MAKKRNPKPRGSQNRRTVRIPQLAVPIGAIFSSILTPDFFAKSVDGEWMLADGGQAPDKSLYAQIVRSAPVGTYSEEILRNGHVYAPDLRGMFLRGHNARRGDSRGNPEAMLLGQYQADNFREHSHALSPTYPNLPNAPDLDADRRTLGSIGWPGYSDATSRPAGGSETRPRNVTVNFFIRVG